MKKRFHSIKKIYIVAVLLIFTALLAVGMSGASYLNQSYKRGVVRNRDEEAIRFTSNYLSLTTKTEDNQETASYAGRIITYPEDASGLLSCEIDVRNYIPGSANLINEYSITYNFQVTLINATPGNKYVLDNQPEIEVGEDGKCSFTLENQILQGRSKNKKTYTIYFYPEDLNKISMKVTAIPENTAYTGNQFLAASIYPCTKSETQPFSCVGRFADQSSGENPSAFDAYNYEIVLANGRAQVTLKWDENLYEIDPFFLDKLGSDNIINRSENTLVFIMDQTEGNGSYIIPFYKEDKEACNQLSWEEMSKKITISAEELAPQSTND